MQVYIKKNKPVSDSLNLKDRRLLLGASLRLLLRRFRCGQPIFKGDVARLASLADAVIARAHLENPDTKSFKMEYGDEEVFSRSGEAGTE